MRIEIKDKILKQIQFKYTNTLTKNKNTRIFKNKNAYVTGSTLVFLQCLLISPVPSHLYLSSITTSHLFCTTLICFLTIPTFPWLLIGLRFCWMQSLIHILECWCLSWGHQSVLGSTFQLVASLGIFFLKICPTPSWTMTYDINEAFTSLSFMDAWLRILSVFFCLFIHANPEISLRES